MQSTPKRQVKAAIYTRVSRKEERDTDSVERHAPSTERQETYCCKRAKREGWNVARVYRDEGRSAWLQRTRRPAFEALCDDVQSGAIDVILAWTDDRLWRHPTTLERLVNLADKTGVRVVFDQGSEVDLNSAQGLVTARTLANMGAFDSHRKSERAKGKALAMATSGVYFGGNRAFGWTRDLDAHGKYRTTSPDPVEAPILADLVVRAANGESLTSLCEELNARGIATSGNAKVWRPTALKRVLTNPRHIGRRVHQGEDFGDAVWPAIVDVAAWHRCVARLTDPSRAQTRRARRYLLSGLLRCSKCGGKMSGQVLHGVPSYRCVPKNQGGCAGTRITAGPLDSFVVDNLFEFIGSRTFARRLRAASGNGRDAVGEMRKLEAEMDELAALLGRKAMTPRQFEIANKALTERMAEVTAEASSDGTHATVGRFAGDASALNEEWDSWGEDEAGLDKRRAVISAVIDGITIRPGTLRGGGKRGPKPLDTGRVEITWKL
jgi:site-specific DNA recombinase